MGIRYAKPPVLLHDVIDDIDAVDRLLQTQAPYNPLGEWFTANSDQHARTKSMWFQKDWVHDDFHAPGSDLFLQHPAYIDAAKAFYEAEIVEPHSIYVNLMTSIATGGPAHTDNPRFHGRDRTNTPMWLLRTMLWSGLFERYEIVQATAIWWMNDVEGGGLYYWPNGPDQPPEEHVGTMANTALFGDNHGMFHQVAPIGPFDVEALLVSPIASLAPVGDESGDWAVTDHDDLVLRAPLDAIRVSVLWKADVFASATERDTRRRNPLSLDDVADIVNDDLVLRDAATRFDANRIDEPAFKAELTAAYPEAIPVGALATR